MAIEDFLNESIPPDGRLSSFQDYLHRLFGVAFDAAPSIPGTSIFSQAYESLPYKGEAELRALNLRYQKVISSVLDTLNNNLTSLNLLQLDVLLDPSYLALPPHGSNYGCVPSLLALVGMTPQHSELAAHLSERVAGLRHTRAQSRSDALLSGFTTASYHSLDTFLDDEHEYRVACRVLGVSPSEQLLQQALMRPLSEYITEMTDVQKHPPIIKSFVSVSSSPSGLGIVHPHWMGDVDEQTHLDGKPSYLCVPLETMLLLLRRVTLFDEGNPDNPHVTLAAGALSGFREYIDTVALTHDNIFDKKSNGLFVSVANVPIYRALRRAMSQTLPRPNYTTYP